MSNFTITASGTKGTIELGSTNGDAHGTPPQAYLSIGAPYGVSVSAPTFGGCPIWKVTRVTFTWLAGFGVFIRKSNPDTNVVLTKYARDSGMIEGNNKSDPSTSLPTTYDWHPANPNAAVAVDFFAGIPTDLTHYSDTLVVIAYYDNGTQDTAQFIVNTKSPSTDPGTALNFQFEPLGNTNVFQFGPWFIGFSGTPYDYHYSPVSWNNITYWNGQTGSDYALGCQAGGLAPWSFSGTIVNNTYSTGTAYCMQIGRDLSPQEITYAHSVAANHYAREFWYVNDTYIFNNPSPKDSSGNTLYGCDAYPGNNTAHQWAFRDIALTVPTPNGPSFPVPPANSIPDLNNNFNSYYADNPGLFNLIPQPLQITLGTYVFIEYNCDIDFKTYLVWEPDGGIPIGMEVQPWNIRCNVYNSTADSTLSQSDGRRVQGYWNTGSGTSFGVGIGLTGPFYIVWPYYLGTVGISTATIRRHSFSMNGGPNGGQMGGSTFGGSPVMIAMNARGLPNGSTSNLGTNNIGAMN